jgi:hypothetical protein
MLSFLTTVSFFLTADLRVALAALPVYIACCLETLAVVFLEALAVVFLAATLL